MKKPPLGPPTVAPSLEEKPPSRSLSSATGYSGVSSTGSTGPAPSDLHSQRPYDAVEPLLAEVQGLPLVLVGGQALNFWAGFFGSRGRLPARSEPLTSKDLDFVGAPDAARAFAQRLGAAMRLADMDHATANYAVLECRDGAGRELQVDFLDRVCGVDPKDLEDTALTVSPMDESRGGLVFRVIHPVVCMESRLSNCVELAKYQDAHGKEQAVVSIACARAMLLELLDAGHIEAANALNERIFRFRMGRTGRKAAERFSLECFDAVVVDDRLPERFRDTRYPQMVREVTRDRVRRRGPGVGR